MQTIAKSILESEQANLKLYEKDYAAFSWNQAELCMTQLPGSRGLNMAFEAIDRHVDVFHHGSRIALRWCSAAGSVKDYTYQRLKDLTNRFANGLCSLGLKRGDALFALSHRVPELYIAVLGTLKHRCIFSPLFAAFGPEPILTRMQMGRAKTLVTSEALYKKKIRALRDQLPDLKHVIITDLKDPELLREKGICSFVDLIEHNSQDYEIGPTSPEDPALIHFTSGTTGNPKGALHVHGAIISHHITGRLALDLHEDDVFWCTADPGWVTGTSYGILSPLSNGVTLVVDEGEFDAERWYQILEQQKVTVWYTAPTAIRLMMKMGEDLARQYNHDSLRFIASVGEPLNPEAVRWGERAFGKPIHDNWWQTETGGIMISNFSSMDIRPGSMGRPMPGIQAAIMKRENAHLVPAAVGEEGELALKTPWPSLFRSYLAQEERYQKCFVNGWYLTGDLARIDADGYYWFVGRADDVIKSAGHLIGPFEVESALLEHPAVAEAAVIGKPDPMLLEVVKAFVTLKKDQLASEELRLQIIGFARQRLGPAVAPRELEIRPTLPRTRSGKIMRRLLKAREMGLPEGDISTLEAEPSSTSKEFNA